MTSLYPFLLNPALHTKVWGGRRLETVLHKALPTSEPYGESWEVHDTASVINGPLAGRTLGSLLSEYGHDLIGPDSDPEEGFPLLAKLLDAREWLSVQVHPNDEQARQFENQPRGKTEAWYVLAADEGAQLCIGITPGTTPAQMADAIRENRLEPLLVNVTVTPGDVLYIPAGTVHALGPGIMIYEIQQSSDTTYRLYDWGRVGLDGKPREMHVDKGVAVSNLEKLPEIKHTGGDTSPEIDIVRGRYFNTVLHQLDATSVVLSTDSRYFHILTVLDGIATVQAEDVHVDASAGQTVLIPSSVGRYTVTGTARILRSFQGEAVAIKAV